MQKPAYFAILAASTVVAASALGVSGSRYLSLRYYAPPSPPVARATQAAAASRQPAPAPDRWTNIFAPAEGMNIPSKIAQSKTEDPAADARYVLIGTIASNVKASRRAIIWAEGMKEPRMMREGEEIEHNVRVASIARDAVWLARGKRREKLELLPVGSKTRVVMPPASPTRALPARPQPGQRAPGAYGEGPPLRVSRLGENLYSLDDEAVGQLTGNINHYMTQVRLIPYFEGNKSAGYRLAAIRPGSAFEQLGFRGGDVIQQVNGVELSSPEKMYTIFQNLKDEKRVTVDIVRQGQKNTITYEIR